MAKRGITSFLAKHAPKWLRYSKKNRTIIWRPWPKKWTK